jgi:hypothetical protein
VDEDITRRWFKEEFIPFTAGTSVLMFLDNLGSQSTRGVRADLAAASIKPWFFPPNCTDIVQPIDRHLAQQVKHNMGANHEGQDGE